MKKIILVITGSIAAYKGINLYKELKKKYIVELILTKDSLNFFKKKPITAKTKIFIKKYYNKKDLSEHIIISNQTDLFIVYPATQNFIAQIANGFTNNLASLLFSVTKSYKMIFPTMNSNMYLSNANLRNLNKLKSDGNQIYEPRIGALACNMVGIGRAWEWEDVIIEINNFLDLKKILKNKKVMLNFGRTRSYLDNVRYLTNSSSGKMGNALYYVLKWTDCLLTTIIGDCDFPIYYKHIKVTTNKEMLFAMLKTYKQQDIVISCAALNDYKFSFSFKGKINKQKNIKPILSLFYNIDVLNELGKLKNKQILIGFSAQNNFNLNYAKKKLINKNLDLIIINKINNIGSDKNEIIILSKNGSFKKIKKQNKIIIAKEILIEINKLLKEKI